MNDLTLHTQVTRSLALTLRVTMALCVTSAQHVFVYMLILVTMQTFHIVGNTLFIMMLYMSHNGKIVPL